MISNHRWLGLRGVFLANFQMTRILIIIFSFLFKTPAWAENHPAAAVFEQFLNSFLSADKETIVGTFDDTAHFWGTGSSDLVEQKAGIQAYFDDVFSRFPAGRADASAVKYSVKELSSNTAILSGSWQIRDTKEDLIIPLRVSALMLNTGQGWKIHQFHNSRFPSR